MQKIRVDSQGRVTIPNRIRKQLGIDQGMVLLAELGAEGLLLRTAPKEPGARRAAESGGEAVLCVEPRDLREQRRILHRLAV